MCLFGSFQCVLQLTIHQQHNILTPSHLILSANHTILHVDAGVQPTIGIPFNFGSTNNFGTWDLDVSFIRFNLFNQAQSPGKIVRVEICESDREIDFGEKKITWYVWKKQFQGLYADCAFTVCWNIFLTENH